MLIRYWHPFSDVEKVRQQIDQVFDQLTETRPKKVENWYPNIELQERGDHLILKAQLPGITAENLEIQVTQDTVSLSGENQFQGEKGTYYYSEFLYGKFERIINLPVPIINDEVHADLTNGVLTLTLPKVTEKRHKVVKINVGNLADTPSNPVLSASENS